MRSLLSRYLWLGLSAVLLAGTSSLLAHGLGVVTVGEERQFDLVYKNIGTTPQELGEIRSHCSCVTILEYPSVVPPGVTVHIPAVHKADKPGRIAVQVDIMGTSGKGPVAILGIEGAATVKGWLLSPADLPNPFAGMLVIDTRSAEEFATMRAKRSVPLSLESLKKRTDLRLRRVLLLDAGIDPIGLLAAVAELRADGFSDVYALDGGIVAWARAGLPMDGESISAASAAMVSPLEFASSREIFPWRILSIQPAPEATVGTSDVVIVSNLEQARAYLTDSGRKEGNCLVISTDANDYARLDATLTGETRRQVRYLRGGPAAWTEFVSISRAVATTPGQQHLSGSTRTSLPSGKCGSCAK